MVFDGYWKINHTDELTLAATGRGDLLDERLELHLTDKLVLPLVAHPWRGH